jgi:hypothetical protein
MRVAVIGGVILLAAGAAYVGWRWLHPRPSGPASDDPRLAYTGPFRNVHPDVAYVGDARCAPCHAEQEKTYRRHPMANTLLPVAAVTTAQAIDEKRHNPFTRFGAVFEIAVEGDTLHHRESRRDAAGKSIFTLDFVVDYAVGSGNHGRSYLSDRGGYLFQTPVSWYASKQVWDLSPGFGTEVLAGRPIGGTCLFCHSNRARHDEETLNRFEDPPFVHGHAIGCERCHGPGGKHVETSDSFDIVNPRHLDWQRREAVCEQCHLEGLARSVRRGRGMYDFRPGLPLEPFWMVLVHAGEGEDRKAVSHVEQMYQSACFRKTDGAAKLGCVSCHDPHVKVGPEARVAHYRERCQRCHESHPCSVAEAVRRREVPNDSCIDCHMPRFSSSDIVHTASTDHRVLRRKEGTPEGSALAPLYPELPVASFYRERMAADPAAGRDLGVALVTLATENKGPSKEVARRALPLLDAALKENPEDLGALHARAEALLLQTRLLDALTATEAVLARAPRREQALRQAATIAEDLRQIPKAIDYWRRAVEVNPWIANYRNHLAGLLAERQAWDEVRPQVAAWLRLAPGSIPARKLWVECLLREGKKDEAKAEFARIEALNPPDLAELRAWFGNRTR